MTDDDPKPKRPGASGHRRRPPGTVVDLTQPLDPDEPERAAVRTPEEIAAFVAREREKVLELRLKKYEAGHVPFDKELRIPFLSVLATTGTFAAACDAVGINRKTVFRVREKDPEFAEACEEALELYRDLVVRAEVRRRGIEGWLEPVYQGGQLVGYKRVFDSQLLQMEAKRVDPAYRDKSTIEHAGGVGVHVTTGVLVVPSRPAIDAPEIPDPPGDGET